MSYGASYTSQFSYASLSGLSQQAGFQASRQLSAKWSFSFVVSAGTSMAQQSLFAPTALANLISVANTLDALSQSAATGALNDTQIAALLTGAPVLSSPAQTLLYGSKFLFSSAQSSVSYAHSSRLRISASVGAGWTKHLNDSSRDAVYSYVLPESKSATASLNVSYSLTPRTQVGFSVSEMRSLSNLLDSDSTSGSVSVTRRMGSKWFLSGSVGVGDIRARQALYYVPLGPQYTASGSIGYKLLGATLMASYQRLMGDSYGLGAETTLEFSGAWSWTRPGSSWRVNVSGGSQRMQFSTISTVNSWRASTSITRRLNPHLSFLISYGFGKYSGYRGPLYDRTQNAVQASLVWTPYPAL
jgi:hypothetical protein